MNCRLPFTWSVGSSACRTACRQRRSVRTALFLRFCASASREPFPTSGDWNERGFAFAQQTPFRGVTPAGQFATEGESDEPFGFVAPGGDAFCTVPGKTFCG